MDKHGQVKNGCGIKNVKQVELIFLSFFLSIRLLLFTATCFVLAAPAAFEVIEMKTLRTGEEVMKLYEREMERKLMIFFKTQISLFLFYPFFIHIYSVFIYFYILMLAIKDFGAVERWRVLVFIKVIDCFGNKFLFTPF